MWQLLKSLFQPKRFQDVKRPRTHSCTLTILDILCWSFMKFLKAMTRCCKLAVSDAWQHVSGCVLACDVSGSQIVNQEKHAVSRFFRDLQGLAVICSNREMMSQLYTIVTSITRTLPDCWLTISYISCIISKTKDLLPIHLQAAGTSPGLSLRCSDVPEGVCWAS